MQAHPIHIRPISPDDLAVYRALRLEALQAHPEAFTSDYAEQAAQPESFWQQRLNDNHNHPHQIIYGAEESDEFVGMTGIGCGSSPKTVHSAWIWGVYVKPTYRGQQLGERLLHACIDWARTHGVKVVKLGVMVGNEAALKCYTRCGFVTYGREPLALCVDGQIHDEWLMALTL